MATSDSKMDDTDEKIFIGKGEQPAWLTLALANRHGLVTGATGTGKTVSLQVMAEGFARAGVPVFAADIKGDLSGIAEVGEAKDFILKRAGDMGLKFQPDQFSTVFWDVFGEQGHPVRATVSEMGPLLLSRMLDLNDVQEGVLNVAFRVADENGLTLIDMKDLRVAAGCDRADRRQEGRRCRGRSAMPRSARPRRASAMSPRRRSEPSSASFWCWKTRAAAKFFGEPALAAEGFHEDRQRRSRHGQHPGRRQADGEPAALRHLPVVDAVGTVRGTAGSSAILPKPKLVFFFDEAHLLFNDAPKALMDKIEQVVRLIRSKGVGVYFVTQNPIDVPDKVLAQLGNRVQHALRAFTPRDQKAVAGGGADLPAQSEARHRPASSPNSARARRWCRSSKATARRRWSSVS